VTVCQQVVKVTKAAEVNPDCRVAAVALETTETQADLVQEDELVPRVSSDHQGGMACLEYQEPRDIEVL